MRGRLIAPLVGLALAAAGLARAADAPAPAPDKSSFTIFNPAPGSDLRSLCTDRPTKSTSPCTVDAGHWQFESDIYDVTRQSTGGVTTTTELFTNPTLKLGVTSTLDFEVNIVPYEEVVVDVAGPGATSRASGIGDLFLRAKWSLAGDDGGDFGLALAPYVKVPTARPGLGDGRVEGGVLAPIQFALPANLQLVLDPEADVLADAAGRGQHGAIAGLISLSYPATKAITLSAEIWGDANFDPTGTITQASVDLGAAWIPAGRQNLQFDGGVNLGLNRATAGVQAYAGISRRF